MLFISYFIINVSLSLRQFCETLEIVYYPLTHVLFVILLFIIATSITNRIEFTTSLRITILIVPIAILSCIFLFVANLENFTHSTIYPILGDGFINTFILGIGNIYSFSGIILLYFLPPLLKKVKDFKKISIISVVIFSIYLIISIATLLFMFSFFMSDDEVLPLYSTARYIQIGTFFVRLESIFLLIWIIVFACYLGVVSKFSMLIFKKITSIKESKILAYPFGILIFSISLLPHTYAEVKKYESDIYPYVVIGFGYIFCIMLLIFANLKKLHKSKKNSRKFNLDSKLRLFIVYLISFRKI